MLPRLLHRAIRRADMEDAAAQRIVRVPVERPSARLERVVCGAALLIAGVLWTGLAEPAWIGWIAAVAGLLVMIATRR
jgi:hypothetical protein